MNTRRLATPQESLRLTEEKSANQSCNNTVNKVKGSYNMNKKDTSIYCTVDSNMHLNNNKIYVVG